MTEHFNKRLNRWTVHFDDGHRMYRYRYVMEQQLGRKLRTDEHVHHINGDSADDRVENLVVVSCKEHRALHAADIPAWTHKGWQHEWARDYPCCIECGTTERPHAGLGQCSRCYFRNRSRRLRGGAPRRPATVIVATCPQCGEEFARTLKQGRRTYCSKPCASAANAQRVWATRRANGTDRGYKKRKAA